jgi:hypothetical protein
MRVPRVHESGEDGYRNLENDRLKLKDGHVNLGDSHADQTIT